MITEPTWVIVVVVMVWPLIAYSMGIAIGRRNRGGRRD